MAAPSRISDKSLASPLVDESQLTQAWDQLLADCVGDLADEVAGAFLQCAQCTPAAHASTTVHIAFLAHRAPMPPLSSAFCCLGGRDDFVDRPFRCVSGYRPDPISP